MTLLLKSSADVNTRDAFGNTALQTAVQLGCLDSVALLIEPRAAVNARGALRRTALHSAAVLGKPKFVQLLVDSGADGSAKDEYGLTAFDYARGQCYKTFYGRHFKSNF